MLMKVMVVGLAVLLVMMAAVPMMDSSFAQSVPPMPDSEDDDHEGKTCPITGQKLATNPFTNF